MPKACNFIEKESVAQMFSYEFCEISNNTSLHRTPLVAASELFSKIVVPSKYYKSYHMRISQLIYTYKSISFAIFLTYLKNNFLFPCAARVSFEYFPLETFAFIINDAIWKEQQRQKGFISDLTCCNEFLKRF